MTYEPRTIQLEDGREYAPFGDHFVTRATTDEEWTELQMDDVPEAVIADFETYTKRMQNFRDLGTDPNDPPQAGVKITRGGEDN